jgi:hypothetical protein
MENNAMNRLIAALEPAQADAFLIVDGVNRRYLTGFASSAGWLLVTRNGAELLVDSRYIEAARAQAKNCTVLTFTKMFDTLRERMNLHGVKTVMLEQSYTTLAAWANLKEKLDDEIFREWCDTHIACQDDRTLKDTLLPVVSKLTDVRIVNNELKGMLAAARNEYWVMVALVVGNIPLLYVLNKEWFHTLIYETSGKVVLGICGVVILVTALFMLKFTKPIEYKR